MKIGLLAAVVAGLATAPVPAAENAAACRPIKLKLGNGILASTEVLTHSHSFWLVYELPARSIKNGALRQKAKPLMLVFGREMADPGSDKPWIEYENFDFYDAAGSLFVPTGATIDCGGRPSQSAWLANRAVPTPHGGQLFDDKAHEAACVEALKRGEPLKAVFTGDAAQPALEVQARAPGLSNHLARLEKTVRDQLRRGKAGECMLESFPPPFHPPPPPPLDPSARP